jgi:hypothetical protein
MTIKYTLLVASRAYLLQDDFVARRHNKNGMFSVRSTYHIVGIMP